MSYVSITNEKKLGLYEIVVFLNIDCQELLDSIGIGHEISEEDENTYEVLLTLTEGEIIEIIDDLQVINMDKKILSTKLLSVELADYTKKIIIEKPNGHNIAVY
tara:strand:- start:118 stop:429 length:312 start_codon:yes stop_codon:yes gene_type:complete